MRENKHEYPCKLQDISAGGAAMMSPVAPEPCERIVAYLDQIGGIEGTVVRLFDGGFGINLVATQYKREKLAAQITWLINRSSVGGMQDRRHERMSIDSRVSKLVLAGNSQVPCKVLDISLSGASIETMARPAIGSDVLLGKLRARVGRWHEAGIGVEFLDLNDAEALRRHFS